MDGFMAIGRPELGGCRGQVVADRAWGEGGTVGDLLDGDAVGGEFEDVGFAGCQGAVPGADGFGGELGVEVASAAVHGADDVGEDVRGDRLGEEPAHTGGQCPLEVTGPSVAGDDDAGASRHLASERFGGSDAVQAGHL
jgi:hypothetical protein